MEKKKLPLYGVGPWYAGGILVLTLIGLYLDNKGYLESGKLEAIALPFRIIGVIFCIIGAVLFYQGFISAKIQKNIKEDKLVTDGIYAYVRNPIYSAAIFFLTGVLFLAENIWLLLLPLLFWAILTFLMMETEEKWLKEKFGQEYINYCKRVNRCIPWKRKK